MVAWLFCLAAYLEQIGEFWEDLVCLCVCVFRSLARERLVSLCICEGRQGGECKCMCECTHMRLCVCALGCVYECVLK